MTCFDCFFYFVQAFPFAFILMSRKTQIAYEDVFEYISEHIFPLSSSQSFTSDYEMAMRNALRKLYPEAKMVACYFHYTQAVKRKLSQLREATDEVTNNDEAKSIYQRLQCLPLLPPEFIVDAFKELVREANKLKNKEALRSFLIYMKEQWIKKVCMNYFRNLCHI